MGGSLERLREDGIHFEIVCLTNGDHPIRSQEFLAACKQLQMRGNILDLADGPPLPDFSDRLDELLEHLNIAHDDLDYVITHSPHGEEAGHPHHRQCFNHVKRWCQFRGLNLGFFSEKEVQPHLFSLKKIYYWLKSRFASFRFAIDIDLSKKHKLLEVYQSRDDVTSNSRFKTYDQAVEYLYLEDPKKRESMLLEKLKAS